MSLQRLALMLLALASPVLAGAVRCTTGGGWQTTITGSPQPGWACRPSTTGHRLEVRCR